MASARFNSEVSSIDTSLFICGVLTCKEYFNDDEISTLADTLYGRLDFAWMLHGDKNLSMGWTPEHGFIKARWDAYSELMMIYLLGIGAPNPQLTKVNWDAWTRTYFEFNGIRYIGSHAPLFVHQFSQAWFDFRGKRDAYADYFTNSVIATKVHKLWCLELAREFPDYSDDLWGITASDSVRGYAIWGGPPAMGRIDGIGSAVRGGRVAAVFAGRMFEGVANDLHEVSGARMEAVRIRGCVQSADELV